MLGSSYYDKKDEDSEEDGGIVSDEEEDPNQIVESGERSAQQRNHGSLNYFPDYEVDKKENDADGI